jgi:putative ABC transport system ATP-binding protein
MGVPQESKKSKAMKLLEKVNLETRAEFMANELSGGEQQRAAIARALINDPEIILADEPLSNIDMDHVRMVVDVIAGLRKKGKTILASFHDSHPVLAGLIDRTVHFESGRTT